MLKAFFSYQIFISEDSIYSVNKFTVKECGKEDPCSPGDSITVLGDNIPTFKNVLYILEGVWEHNKRDKGQMQFRMYGYNEERPTSGSEVLNYLESGIIKGIGKKNAKVIFSKFGADSLNVIENSPEELIKLKGFGPKSVGIITQSYKSHMQAKDTLLFLGKLGVSSKLGMKIYERYKDETEEKIRQNPYILCDMKGIGFEMADDIAMKIGYEKLARKRIEAGISWTLKILENEEGNLGSPVSLLEKRLYQVLKIPKIKENADMVNFVSREMINDKKVIISKGLCYRPVMFELESECAHLAVRLMNGIPFKYDKDLHEAMQEAQEAMKITLDEIQVKAVERAVLDNFLIITGGPGSGKTTTILCIVKVFEALFPKKKIRLMAPTGRASRRMTESTGMASSTIHSALRLSTDEDSDREIEEPQEDIIIVDEVSMIDIRIATYLFRALGKHKKLILIGDSDQLPSVGPGAVLRDLISSNVISVVKLERTFRQEKDSLIYINSKKIKKGETDLIAGDDFRFIRAETFEESAKIMLQVYQEKIQQWGIENVACLTPYRKYAAGCEHLNKELQEIANPFMWQNQILHRNTYFREKDYIMNLNNALKGDIDVANGDIGKITSVDLADKSIQVEFFGDSYVTYEFDELDELELAYSYTIHKSQGSEYPCIITNLCRQHIDKMKTRNIIYTAVTRAKKEVIFIGDPESLADAICNVDDKRYTLLAEKIRAYNKIYNMTH